VQFWKRGEPHAFPGYTTNISLTGMFIATRSPQPPGTRLRIEVLEAERGFVIEGVVAHARKVRGEMMHVSQPGMGIRFVGVEELVRELIPAAYSETEGANSAVPVYRPAPEPTAPWPELAPSPEPLPSPPASATSATSATSPASPASPSAAAPVRPPAPAHSPRPASPPIPTPREGGGVFAVHFLGPEEFLEVYRRDILNGGLFVSTRFPGKIQETVSVELHPPVAGATPVLCRARVVQRFEPQATEIGANLLSGMGVELLDLPRLLDSLRGVLERLAPRPG
jgi:hypothetical protein